MSMVASDSSNSSLAESIPAVFSLLRGSNDNKGKPKEAITEDERNDLRFIFVILKIENYEKDFKQFILDKLLSYSLCSDAYSIAPYTFRIRIIRKINIYLIY